MLMKSGCKHVNNRVMQHKQTGNNKASINAIKDRCEDANQGSINWFGAEDAGRDRTCQNGPRAVPVGASGHQLTDGGGAEAACPPRSHRVPAADQHRSRSLLSPRSARRPRPPPHNVQSERRATMLPSAGVGISSSPAVRERLLTKIKQTNTPVGAKVFREEMVHGMK